MQQSTLPPASKSASASTVAPTTPVGSWMARGLKTRDLLYISNGNGTVDVYRYWQRTLVGVLTNFAKPAGECADQVGDVYIADYQNQKVYKYAHGGKKPIAVLDQSPYGPYGCSVDPSTGDLAVANYDQGYYSGGDIAVYPHGSGKPTIYTESDDDRFISCAYDDRGDLFVTDRYYYYYSYFYDIEFYYLPKHGSKLLSMDVADPNSSSGWPYIEGVGWDGTYWIVESYGDLYRFEINIKAKYVSETEMSSAYDPVSFAFYRKKVKSPATQVVAATSGFSGAGEVDYWPYPTGGNPLHTITKDLDAPFGAAISLGTQ